MTPAGKVLTLFALGTGALYAVPRDVTAGEVLPNLTAGENAPAPRRARPAPAPDYFANCSQLDAQLSLSVLPYPSGRVDYELHGRGEQEGIYHRIIGDALTRFTVRDGVLYRTIAREGASGCRLTATDLVSGHALWDRAFETPVLTAQTSVGLTTDQWGPGVVVKLRFGDGGQATDQILDGATGQDVDPARLARLSN